MRRMSNYNDNREIACQHQRKTNVMTNVSRVSRKETLHCTKTTVRLERLALVRPEQKNVSSMKDLVRKLTRGEELTVSFCACTCPTAKPL